MKKIKVFYHVYIPFDARAHFWSWYLDDQLGMIKRSRLGDCAQIHMCVTMPMHWTSLFGEPILSCRNPSVNLTFYHKLIEYMETRYPWVNILEVRDSSANLFEGNTLKHLYDQSLCEDFNALYIHTKAIHLTSANTLNWRDILNHYHIKGWSQAQRILQTHDVIGLQDAHSENHDIVSGNFFWCTSEHVRKLQDPLQVNSYNTHNKLPQDHMSYRYNFELWILSAHARTHYWAHTHTNHYEQYCFLEDLLKKYPLN